MTWITKESQGATWGGGSQYRQIGKSKPAAYVYDNRYTLWRWQNGCRDITRMAAMIGTNPSTATPNDPDPTVAKWKEYTQKWDFGGWCVVNVHPYRATDPEDMKAHVTPEAEYARNMEAIRWVCERAGLVVCAWGNDGAHDGRASQVRKLLEEIGRPLYAFHINKTGEPKHMLYHKKAVELKDLILMS